MAKRQLSAGERYLKRNEMLPVVYVVDRVVELPGLPKHVRLQREDNPLDCVTVSLDTLLDPRFYKPLARH